MIRIDFAAGHTTTAATLTAALADVRRSYPTVCFYTNGGLDEGYCVIDVMAGDEHELRAEPSACIEAWAHTPATPKATGPRRRVAVLHWQDATAEQLGLW